MAETEKLQIKYSFTRDEQLVIAKDLGRYNREKTRLDEELKAFKAGFNSNVARLDANIQDCSRWLDTGYEMRDIKCIVLKRRPDSESVLIVRLDNGRVYRKRKLADDERQMKIVVEGEPVDFYTHEADFYEDTDDAMATEIAADCPLTSSEAMELSKIEGFKVRPLAKKLEAGPQ